MLLDPGLAIFANVLLGATGAVVFRQELKSRGKYFSPGKWGGVGFGWLCVGMLDRYFDSALSSNFFLLKEFSLSSTIVSVGYFAFIVGIYEKLSRPREP